MFFDVIFFTQHYFLYPGKEVGPSTGEEDAQALLAEGEGSVQQVAA